MPHVTTHALRLDSARVRWLNRDMGDSGHVLFVPGRLCLFGEHSDWAGGLRTIDPTIVPGACIVTATSQGMSARAESAAQFEMTARLLDGRVMGPVRLPMDAEALGRTAASGGFFSYAAGAALEVWERVHPPGVRIIVTASDLPLRRGLSSSAATCVLVARAFNRAHDLGLELREEMEIAYRGELRAGSLCGRMDQVCAVGKRQVLLRFDGDGMDMTLLRPRAEVYLLLVDLEQGKDTRRILADLHACFVGPECERRRALRAALGEINADIIARAQEALESGDPAALGALMTQAQAVFDRCVAPACLAELAAPRLHAVLRHPATRELAYGGKGVGSQGDGSAQLICRGPAERRVLARRLEADYQMQCLALTIGATRE